MRTYLPRREELDAGSDAESAAIICVDLLADELRRALPLETLREIEGQ